MLDRVWVIGTVMAFSVSVNAGGIYKCVSSEGTAYQSAPCANGSEHVLAVSATADSLPARANHIDDSTARDWNQVAETAGGVSAGTAALGRTTLALGITDDQALNTPGWGPPKKIMRHRERSGWREVWTYAHNPSGGPQLEFFNGRLVAISTQMEPAETSRLVSVSAE